MGVGTGIAAWAHKIPPTIAKVASALGNLQQGTSATASGSGVGGDGAVAPGVLGPVERGVGALQQVLEGLAGGAGGDADRDRERVEHEAVAAPLQAQRGHAQAQRFGDMHGVARRGSGKQQQEFLAAEAHRVVACAQAAAQGRRDGSNHGVAEGVAVAVVDALEMVDVDHRHAQRQRSVVAADFGQTGVEAAPVPQLGQRVEQAFAVALAQLHAQVADLGHRGVEPPPHLRVVCAGFVRRADHGLRQRAQRVGAGAALDALQLLGQVVAEAQRFAPGLVDGSGDVAEQGLHAVAQGLQRRQSVVVEVSGFQVLQQHAVDRAPRRGVRRERVAQRRRGVAGDRIRHRQGHRVGRDSALDQPVGGGQRDRARLLDVERRARMGLLHRGPRICGRRTVHVGRRDVQKALCAPESRMRRA